MRSLWLAVVVVAVALPAAAADRPAHRVEGDAAIAARRVLQKHCTECHGDADAKKRKGRFWVNDWATLVGTGRDAPPVPFVSLDSSNLRSQVLEFLKDGSMPPGGRTPPSADEVKAVEGWLTSADGAKPFPPRFDTDAVLQLILKDPGRAAKDTKNVRYVSFAHLVDRPGADLGKAEGDLAAALGELLKGVGRPTADVFASALRPVKGSAGTVFRLDLEAFGWHDGEHNLFELTRFGQVWRDEEFRMIPFDLIQLEYPYTHPAKGEQKEAVGKLLADLNAHRKGDKDPLAQLRAVPYVQGDWLAEALRQGGELTALARDLEALAKLPDALKAEEAKAKPQRRVGVGPKFAPFSGGPKVTDATAPSPWAWYQGNVSSLDKEFLLNAQTDAPEDQLKPNGRVLLTASSPNRAVALTLIEVQDESVFVLALKKGAEMDAGVLGPVSSVNNPEADESTRYKMQPVKIGKDGKFQYLLLATPKPTPARPPREPVVVRSRHESSAVWRILPNAADATEADPPPVVRRVLPLNIKATD